ncbi:MAG: type II toxin-antitoxin system RelB/DinJ family antitoxin [Clostridia bacterium]
MAKTSNVYVRLEPKMKEQAEAVLEQIGIPMSNAIALFLQQVIIQRGIPFELKLKATPPVAAGSLSDEEFDTIIESAIADYAAGRGAAGSLSDAEFDAIIERIIADYAAGRVTSAADIRLQLFKN